MSLLGRFVNLWRRPSLEREFDDELQFHFEMRVDANQRAGMSRVAAEEEARRHLRRTSAREGMRDARIILWLDELGRDLRQGARRFARDPGTTALAILTLSLGIGANTVIFSLLHAVLFRPLPFPDSDRLVSLFDGSRVAAQRGVPPTVPEWIDVRDGRHRFAGLSFYDTRDVQLSGGTEPARAFAARAEATFLDVLGARTQLGRLFAPGENDPGRDRVVVLTDGLWRRTFGADPKVIGSTIRLNGAGYTVIGVLAADFSFDYQVPEPIELFIPFTMSSTYTSRAADFTSIRRVSAIARLEPGVSIEEASNDVRAIGDAIAKDHPELYRRNADGQDIGFYMDIEPLKAALSGRGRTILWFLFGAVTLVLLVACVNTAQFLMARAMERRPEVAIRMALGAGRARLLRQFLAEAFLLGAIAAVAGLLQAVWLMPAMIATLPSRLTPTTAPQLDLPVLTFTAILSVIAALLFGLLPAWQFSRATALRRLEQYAIGGGRSRPRQALIAFEVGVSIVLLVVAGLLFQSISQLQQSPTGYSSDDVTLLRIRASATGTVTRTTGDLYARYIERITQIPGVESAAVADGPLAGAGGLDFTIPGRENSAQQLTSYRIVSPGYFATLQIPVLQGRVFNADDTVGRPPVAIINEEMARRYWPNENPIGRTLRAGPGPRMATMTIVGVVGNVRPVLLDATSPQLYVSSLQQSEPSIVLLVRKAPNAAVSTDAIKQAVWSVVPDQPLFDIRPMNELVARQLAEPRAVGRLLAAFATLGLAMSTMGIYMIVTYLTSRRSKEVALRRAVGAQRGDVLSLLAGQTLRWSIGGLAIGVIAASAASRALKSSMVGVLALEPQTVIAMSIFYLVVIVIAMAVPVLRAMRLDPAIILRAE